MYYEIIFSVLSEIVTHFMDLTVQTTKILGLRFPRFLNLLVTSLLKTIKSNESRSFNLNLIRFWCYKHKYILHLTCFYTIFSVSSLVFHYNQTKN